MDITKTKILSGLLGTGLTTGIVLFNTNYSNKSEEKNLKPTTKVKLGTKYKAALIDENSIWNSRFDDLKKGDPKNPDLLVAKSLSKDIGPWELKDACQKIIDGEDGENYFSDFQKFCVMKNKDAVTLMSKKEDFNSKYSSFSKADKTKLSMPFAKIWENKGNTASDDWRQKMWDECKRLEEKMYVIDREDENFAEYCVKNS